MDEERLVPTLMAVTGCVAIVIGLYQGLVHVAPGYEGTIASGWDGPLSHEEVLLGWLAVAGLGGALAARRWKRLAAVPIATGAVVLFYALRAVFIQFQQGVPLYREVTLSAGGFDGDTVVFVLGAEPFLLVAGAALLVASGVSTLRTRSAGGANGDLLPPSAS
jgi:hypothetical protein